MNRSEAALLLLCEREAFRLIEEHCGCGRDFTCRYHLPSLERALPERLARFLMFRAKREAAPLTERSYRPIKNPPTMAEIREWHDGFPVGSFAEAALGKLLSKLDSIMSMHDGCQRECLTCGILACPDDEPLHHDKDGCPSCVFMDPATPEADVDAAARKMGVDPDALAKRGREVFEQLDELAMRHPWLKS